MRLDHQKGDVFVMVCLFVCVIVTCKQTYGCRTSCFERDHMLVLDMMSLFPLFFCSTAHIIQSLIHTRSQDYYSTVSREPTSIPPPERVSYSYLSRSGMHRLRYIPDIHLILICQPSILLFLHLSQWNTQKLQNTDEESLHGNCSFHWNTVAATANETMQ